MATDYERLRAMKDEDIDCSDIPPLDDLLETGEWLSCPAGSEHLYFAIDGKTFRYFKNTGKGYLDRLNILINELLRDYVNRQQKADGKLV